MIEAERLADDLFGDFAAADALGADEHCPVGAVARHMQPLQIRLELPLGDAGDLGPDAAQVLGLATDGDLIAHLWAFAANFANSSHDNAALGGEANQQKIDRKLDAAQDRTGNHIVYQSEAGGQGAKMAEFPKES